ncbi:anti-sigma factor [Mycolicibacterium boenickei]
MPAHADALAVLRALTGSLADYEELDGDTAADLALAVDEACTVLIGMATADASVVLVEDPRAHEVTVRLSTTCDAPEDDPASLTVSRFSLRVLEALTDKVGTFVEDAVSDAQNAAAPMFGISLTFRRRWAPARP